jgi:ecotin
MQPSSLIAIFVLVFEIVTSHAADNMKAFPPAEKGMIRYVLQLQPHADENTLKVELIVGKTVQLEERNRYFFGGRIEAENIDGWGYTRYNVAQLGPLAGTLMAVDPNAPKVDRFIQLSGEPYLIRYNSRLPVVVYVPDGVEVRYRVWSTGTEAKALDPG